MDLTQIGGHSHFWIFGTFLIAFVLLYVTTDRWFSMRRQNLNIQTWTATKNGEKPAIRHVSFTEAESEGIMKLMTHIVKAHRYSRSGKTIYELNEAYNIVQRFLEQSNNWKKVESLGLPEYELQSNDSNQSTLSGCQNTEPEVCPEVYMGMRFGWPYYYTGYITDYENCTGQPLGSVVSVLVNIADDVPVDSLKHVLNGLKTFYPNISVLVAYNAQQNISQFAKYSNAIFVKTPSTNFSGVTWQKLAKYAKTKYIFVGKQMLHFDNHTSMERLLRFVSYNIADVVGTSYRYKDGRWFRGCHAVALRNYTLKFVDGYDLSYNSCIYCNYLTGPFLIRREMFIDFLDTQLNNDIVFVDMFLNMSEKSRNILSCPDVMTTIVDKELQTFSKNDWFKFVRKWSLNRIIFTNGGDLRFSCSESDVSCSWTGGLIMPICCIQELVDMMKFIVTTLEKNNITVELEGGSNVGAAKMYGVVPYERDADFDWPVTEHKKFASLTSEFSKNGYDLVETPNDYKCIGNMSQVNCGYFAVKNENWRIEMWGGNSLGSDEAIRVGLFNRTRVMIDGIWMVSYHSPAAAARNQYSDDIYKHVEHWITLGYRDSMGWVQPKSGRWLPCPKLGFHGCLDKYLPLGDIQFKDVWV